MAAIPDEPFREAGCLDAYLILAQHLLLFVDVFYILDNKKYLIFRDYLITTLLFFDQHLNWYHNNVSKFLHCYNTKFHLPKLRFL